MNITIETKTLYNLQEKLRTIDTLSNVIQKIDNEHIKDVAYLIHKIIDSESINSELAREITKYSILANKDLFISVNN